MDILYQNVAGLRTKTRQFLSLVESSAVDLIIITESSANASLHNAEIAPPGFQVLRCDRADGRKQGGVMLVAPPRFELREVALPSDVNIDAYQFELVIATVHRMDRYLFTCCAVYIPPSANDNNYLLMFNLIENICVKYKGNLIVIGDFNMFSCSSNIVEYYEYFISYCEFVQSNDVLNCDDRRLDLVLVGSGVRGSVEVRAADEGLQPVDRYHPPLSVSVGCGARRGEREHPPRASDDEASPKSGNNVWNFAKADFHALYYAMANIDWGELFAISDPIGVIDFFYTTINSIIDDCVPIKKRKPVNSRYSYPEWYTADIIRDIKLKYRLHKKYKTTKSSADYQAFSDCRARVKAATASAHDLYRDRVQSHLASDPKSFWSYIKSRKGNTGKQMLVKDGITLSQQDCANAFAEYFYSVYNPNPAQLDPAAASAAGGAGGARVHIDVLEPADVDYALARLGAKRSAGPDGIPSFLFKDCRKVLAEPLLYIFNICLRSATFPEKWKLTRVVPVPKGGGGPDTSDYRPVAVLCTPAKVFEAAVHRALHLQVNSQLSEAQYGFRPARSTTGNLLHLMANVVPAVDAGGQVDVAYFDFKKAFDTVDNDILLIKLARVGCTPHTLNFFAEYMRGRQQYVDCAGHRSQPYFTRSGVSQGSNLGPLEFIIMINDLPQEVANSICLLFADDLKLVKEIREESDCLELQADIDRVVAWSNANQLFFNVTKCQVISFSRRQSPHHYDYRVDGVTMQRVTEVRDLGIRFSADLSFRDHIRSVCKKAFRHLGFIMRQSYNFTNITAIRALYEAIVKSHLECNSVIWSPHEEKYRLMLERIQNKFVRAIYLKMYGVYPFYPLMYPTLFVLGMVGYTQLEVRRELALATYVMQLLRGTQCNPGVLRMVSLNVPDRMVGRRRRAGLLAVPRARTNLLRDAPLTRALRVLNCISETVDIFCCSLNEFTKTAQSALCYNDKLRKNNFYNM